MSWLLGAQYMYHVRNGVKVPLAHNIWQPCKHSINQVRFDRRNESILRREVEVGEGDELAFGPPPLGPNRSSGPTVYRSEGSPYDFLAHGAVDGGLCGAGLSDCRRTKSAQRGSLRLAGELGLACQHSGVTSFSPSPS